MLPYAGYVDPDSTLAIGVHHDGHLEATERTFCSLFILSFLASPLLPTSHGALQVESRVPSPLQYVGKSYIYGGFDRCTPFFQRKGEERKGELL